MQIKPSDFQYYSWWTNFVLKRLSAQKDYCYIYQDQILLRSFSFFISSTGLLYTTFVCRFSSLVFFMQYDQHISEGNYISTTIILNLFSKKVFSYEKLASKDRRFSESTKYSFLGMNSNYRWFFQRTSTSRAVILPLFDYWDVESWHFGRACRVLVVYSLIIFSSTPPP